MCQRAQLVLRESQPVGGRDRATIPFVGEFVAQRLTDGRNPDEVFDLARAACFEAAAALAGDRDEAGRIAAKAVRQTAPQRLVDGCAIMRQIVVRQKQAQARPPTVIARHLGIEAQHFRAVAAQGGVVAQAGKLGLEDGLNGFAEKQAGKL